MIFLGLLAVIGLVAIVASLHAIRQGGYAPIRTRDSGFYRDDFHSSGFMDAPPTVAERANQS
ncbi:hypothetical protein JOE66_000076 [Subtercola frigoramans]|uniref:Uncharacterized protein n=1 Tax=Subtercola frigoramans TaxID=120298 RepID=A0ABS2L058_9MICO|nr:hypothetical protein [Subtercola frigoramans]